MTCNVSDLLHNLTLAHRTLETVHGIGLYARGGKGGTSRKSASAAVGTGQKFGDLTHAGVLFNLEFS